MYRVITLIEIQLRNNISRQDYEQRHPIFIKYSERYLQIKSP